MEVISLLQQFDDCRDSISSATARETDGESCSYHSLDAISNAVGQEVACALRRLMLPPDGTVVPRIAVITEEQRGIVTVVAIIGIIKAAAIPVVITPHHAHQLTPGRFHLLITNPPYVDLQLDGTTDHWPPTLVLNPAAITCQGLTGKVLLRAIHLPSFDGFDKVTLLHRRRAAITNRHMLNCIVDDTESGYVYYQVFDFEGDDGSISSSKSSCGKSEVDRIALWRTAQWRGEKVGSGQGWVHQQPSSSSSSYSYSNNRTSSRYANSSSSSSYSNSSTCTNSNSSNLNSSNSDIIAHHICTVVAQVRGRRPGPSSSFAALGVDSLAAVVFVKRLSGTACCLTA